MAKTDKMQGRNGARRVAPTEFGLVCDAGSSNAGLYGLTDLFKYAGDFAARRRRGGETPAVRITHWHIEEGEAEPRCTYDTRPGVQRSPAVLVLPGNAVAPEARANRALIAWLRGRHEHGAVLAAVCGGVFILAETGLLEGRQATTHWSFADRFAERFPGVLTETDRMVIDYGDVVTAGGVLAWADLGLCLTERFLGPSVMIETARYMNIDPTGRDQRFYGDLPARTKHGDGVRRLLRRASALLPQRHGAEVDETFAAIGVEARPDRFFQLPTGFSPDPLARVAAHMARSASRKPASSVDSIDDDVANRLRYSAGLRPIIFRNMRRKAATSSYPTRAATTSTCNRENSSSSRARLMRSRC